MEDPLDAVRFSWDTAYEITRGADGRCRAVRRDGLGKALEANHPDGLNRLIAADYQAKPVSREVA